MNWQEKLSNKVLEKWLRPIIFGFRMAGATQGLSFKDREKFFGFAKGFMKFVLGLATFVSFSLITFYLYTRYGQEKVMVILLMLIFIQLLYLNSGIKDLK
jgi:hypothetical protein